MTEHDDGNGDSVALGEIAADNTDDSDHAAPDQNLENNASAPVKRRVNWPRVLAYGILPGLTLLLAVTTGLSKWHESSEHSVQIARIESVAAAKESAVAILSYQPDSVEKSLVSARDRLMSPYRDAYIKLTEDLVIPSARHDHVAVRATVPAASSVSATPTHAVAILFVDQAVTAGTNPPNTSLSSIRVTLDKVGGRWLISGFDPI